MDKISKVYVEMDLIPKKKSQNPKDIQNVFDKKKQLNATLSNDFITFSSNQNILVEKNEKNPLKRESTQVTSDETLREKPHKKLKTTSPEFNLLSESVKSDNNIVREKDYIAPWISSSTIRIKNSLARLHNEIIDFFNYITPSEEEHISRLEAIKKLEEVIFEAYPEANILPFGSFKTKLYLPNADIDLVILQESKSSNHLLNKIANILLKREDLYERVNIIKSAKVPIIKLVEKEHSYNFDISFNKFDGIKQLKEAEKAFEIYPEMKFLIIIVKCILRQRDLHETYTGGIGSFLLFCMVLAFLREVRKDYFKSNRLNELQNMMLSEYLLKFLEFYGLKFDLNLHQIIMQDGGSIVEKNNQNSDYGFSLISPQDATHDIGNASFRIKEIFNVFKNRFNFLTNYNFEEGESVLKYLINPSKKVFSYIKEKKK